MFRNKPSEDGQTLLELVVVISVVVVVVGALTFATIASIRNASFAQNQLQATKLAQEGLEKVRSLRDRDTSGSGIWSIPTSCGSSVPSTCPATQSSCPSGATNNCYFFFQSGELINGTSVNSESIQGKFKRQFFIEGNENQKKVTVVVTWTDFSGSHESRLTTILRRL